MTETEQTSSASGSEDETSDHKAFRESLDEMFTDRFTDDDVEFMRAMAIPLAPPPTVHNWYTRPKRTFDWTRDRDNRGRGGQRHSGRPHYAGSRDHYRDQYQDKRQYQGGGHHDRHHRPDNRHHPYRGRDQRQQGHYQGHNQGHRHQDRQDRQDRQSYH